MWLTDFYTRNHNKQKSNGTKASTSAKKALTLQSFPQCYGCNAELRLVFVTLWVKVWCCGTLPVAVAAWDSWVSKPKPKTEELLRLHCCSLGLLLTTVSYHYLAPVIKTDLCMFSVHNYVCCTHVCHFVVLVQQALYVCTWSFLILLYNISELQQ